MYRLSTWDSGVTISWDGEEQTRGWVDQSLFRFAVFEMLLDIHGDAAGWKGKPASISHMILLMWPMGTLFPCHEKCYIKIFLLGFNIFS